MIELIELLVSVHPSRFILLDLRENFHELGAAIGDLSYDKAGSQLIVIEAPLSSIAAVASVVRSDVLSGVSTELFLYDSGLTPAALQALLPLSDAIFLSSGLFDGISSSGWGDGRVALFRQILDTGFTIVDSEWLRFSTLREEIRRSFDRASRETLGKINSIVIEFEASQKGYPSVALLAMGWCVERLGLRFVGPALDGYQFQHHAFGNGNVSLLLKGTFAVGSKAEVRKVTIACGDQSVKISHTGTRISADVSLGTAFHVERSFETESDWERLRRYFLIGESVTNYRPALAAALKLL